ncbi:MAG: tetratricopeptide repeat protein [Dehalococcoidales bacterium]|nr:tetratricopeptide repeat protein [Dehalococcoidales bacterium]
MFDKQLIKLFESGLKLLKDGQYAQALKTFNEIIILYPECAEAWVNKGVALKKLGRFQEAFDIYDTAIALNSKDSDAWFNKGLCTRSVNAKDVLALGAESYNKAVTLDSKCSDAWVNLGNVALRIAFQVYKTDAVTARKWYKKAERAYNKALSLAPESFELYCNKGVLFTKQGKIKEALGETEKSLELNPKYADAWYCKGYILGEMKKDKEALKAYKKAIALKGWLTPWAWINIGNLLADIGKYEESLSAYETAIELLSKNPDPWFSKDPDPWFSKDPDPWYNKAVVLNKLGRAKEAKSALKKYLNLREQTERLIDTVKKETGPAAKTEEHVKKL